MASFVAPTGSTNQPGGTASNPASTGPKFAASGRAMQDSEELRRLLMGNARGSMNLKAVCACAKDLRKSLDQIAQGLAYNAHAIKWTDALDKFAVLQVQYHSLLEQLRILLKHCVVHPKSVNQATAPMLPIMLATMELPEMKEQESRLLASQGTATDTSVHTAFESLRAQLDTFGSVIEKATVQSATVNSGLLDVKSHWRRDIANAARLGPAAAISKPALQKPSNHGRQEVGMNLLDAVRRGEGLKKPKP